MPRKKIPTYLRGTDILNNIKLPPQDIDAEKSVLAACLLLPDNIEYVDLLFPSDFYKTSHQKIFQAIIDLVAKEQVVDIAIVALQLKDKQQLSEIGGAVYLGQLIEAPVATDIQQFAKKIKATSLARDLIKTSHEIISNCYKPEVEKTLEDAQSKILKLSFNVDNKNLATLPDILDQRIEYFEKITQGEIPAGIKTGFRDIDVLTGGFKGSKLIIIAARPRIGKTSFMLSMAANMAKSGHKVGIFSIEMDKEDIVDRMISAKSGINLIRLANEGVRLNHQDWDNINDGVSKIYSYPILIDDTGGLPISELKRRSKKMVKDGVEIIFIDQLSKIKGGQGKSEYEKRSHVVNEIATLKKVLRIPICLLAQINRKLEDRENKKPGLGDLKSTGSLEEDADIVFLGHRSYEYTHLEEERTTAFWEIAKHRQGATRDIKFYWDCKTTTFSPAAKEIF